MKKCDELKHVVDVDILKLAAYNQLQTMDNEQKRLILSTNIPIQYN